jgi:hypothetical protein
MKNLGKKIVTVSMGVAFSLPAMAIQPLDDDFMGSVTGQAGISIEVDEALLTIGEFRYQDQGSIAVRDIRVGGANKTNFFGNQWIPTASRSDKLDAFKIDIDVLADGDFVAVMKPSGTFSVVDFGVSTGEWVLMDSALNDGTRLVSSFNMTGVGIDARLRIDNQTSHTFIETTFGIDDLDVDFEFINVRVENMQVAGKSYLETIGTWGANSAGIPDIGAEFDLELYAAFNATTGISGLGLNITRFQADVVLPEIYFGANPSIGQLTLNNVDITAQTVIYGH